MPMSMNSERIPTISLHPADVTDPGETPCTFDSAGIEDDSDVRLGVAEISEKIAGSI